MFDRMLRKENDSLLSLLVLASKDTLPPPIHRPPISCMNELSRAQGNGSSIRQAYLFLPSMKHTQNRMWPPSPYPCRAVTSVFISSLSSARILEAIGHYILSYSQFLHFLARLQAPLIGNLCVPRAALFALGKGIFLTGLGAGLL